MDRYHLVIKFISLEIFLIAVFVVLAFAFYINYKLKEKREEKIANATHATLKNIMSKKQYIPLPYHKPVRVILKLLEIYNTQHQDDPFWQQCLHKIMQVQILPYARNYINKRNWFKKYLLLKCYKLYITPEDESNLITLVEQHLPVLFINTAKVSSKLPRKKVFIAFIYRLSQVHKPLANVAVMQLSPSQALQSALHEVLDKETDPLLRRACFLIIRNAGKNPIFYDDVIKDINVEDLELSISAIRTLPFTDQEKALSYLIKLIKLPNWELRNAATKALGRIHSSKAIPYLLEQLSDQQWWVRFNAAKMLSLHSDDARAQLKSIGDRDLTVKKYADYFLSIYKIKQGKYHA